MTELEEHKAARSDARAAVDATYDAARADARADAYYASVAWDDA